MKIETLQSEYEPHKIIPVKAQNVSNQECNAHSEHTYCHLMTLMWEILDFSFRNFFFFVSFISETDHSLI